MVVQAIPKASRGELAVELMTELGWTLSSRGRRRGAYRAGRVSGGKAVARWRDTAREAAKQARRAWLPDVAALTVTNDVVVMIKLAACAVVLGPGASLRLADVRMPRSGDVIVVVGPEGGLTEREGGAFAAAGAVPVRLGPSVLRASTAGAVAAAVLLSRVDR